MDDQSPHSPVINDLVSDGIDVEARRLGHVSALRSGLRRALIALGLLRPSFNDKVDAYRRGTAQDRRCLRQARRCTDGIERARARLQRMAQRLSNGGVPTTVRFWPIAYKIGTNRKDRKFGFAEMTGVIVLSTKTPVGRQITSLPITISSTRDRVAVLPSIATLQASGQKNAVVDLFLEIVPVSGDSTEHGFCERFEDALARAVATGRLST